MVRFRIFLLALLYSTSSLAASGPEGELKDLYFGEALFEAHQEDWFGAISRLDTELSQYHGLDEPELNSLYHHIDHAEFSVGDFELYYRMHTRAGRAIKAVIEGNVEERVRNEAIYRLAKIYYQKQQPAEALSTIESLKGKVPEHLRFEEPYLRALVYIDNGKFEDAIQLLRAIETEEGMLGFAGYNIAVALFKSGKEEEALKQLDKVGKLQSKDEKVLSMRDKANLVLGFRLLESQQPVPAKQYLDRVRIKGPFSDKALLGSGWAAAAAGKYDRALVPWTILSRRNVTNRSVQEVLLGAPYAYQQLKLYGKSAILYNNALNAFTSEIDRLDKSITSIRQGKFLEAVIREELKSDSNWLVKLRELPDAPETFYMLQMLASHDFQESLKNYFDLAELQRRMDNWLDYLDAYQDMINIRRGYYEPLLPEIEQKFRELDSKMKLRVAQRNKLDSRLKKMLISPRADFLATVNERIILQALLNLEASRKKEGTLDDRARARIARLRGVIDWNIETEYQDRFTEAHNNLRQLDEYMEKLDRDYQSFVRTRQAATQSYNGYEAAIQQLQIKIRMAQSKIQVLMARQGHMIETMAVSELERRRQRLEEYQVKARFAMAENYDRATRGQQMEIEKEAAEAAAEAAKEREAAMQKLKEEDAKRSKRPIFGGDIENDGKSDAEKLGIKRPESVDIQEKEQLEQPPAEPQGEAENAGEEQASDEQQGEAETTGEKQGTPAETDTNPESQAPPSDGTPASGEAGAQ